MKVTFGSSLLGLTALAALLLCPTISRAQGLIFSFANSAQSAPRGGTLQYSGTITNNSGVTQYLTFASLSLIPSTVATTDDSVFFDNVTQPYLNGSPVSLANASSLTLTVFAVTVDANAILGGVANGLFSIQADTSADPNTPGTSISTSDVAFTVTATNATAVTAPEPASGAMVVVSLLGTVGMVNRRKKSSLIH